MLIRKYKISISHAWGCMDATRSMGCNGPCVCRYVSDASLSTPVYTWLYIHLPYPGSADCQCSVPDHCLIHHCSLSLFERSSVRLKQLVFAIINMEWQIIVMPVAYILPRSHQTSACAIIENIFSCEFFFKTIGKCKEESESLIVTCVSVVSFSLST